MKAYLIEQPHRLTPFNLPASQIQFQTETVVKRLTHQLSSIGCEIIVCQQNQNICFEPHSIIVFDTLFLSRNFLKQFIEKVMPQDQLQQCVVQKDIFQIFYHTSTSETSKNTPLTDLPLFYNGQLNNFTLQQLLKIIAIKKGNANIDSPTLPPQFIQPKPIYSASKIVLQLTEGLPNTMHRTEGLAINYLDHYAISMDYWFDVLTAFSLLCREHASHKIQAFGQCPAPIRRLARSGWLRQKLIKHTNQIGKGCHIHPTAQIEGCVIGNNVHIGPFCCLRSSIISSGACIREHSAVNFSYIGEKAYLMGCSVFNAMVGKQASVFSPMFYNSIIGERSFLSGGSGFSDFNANGKTIVTTIDDKEIQSHLLFLGSAIGQECFIGADLIFSPGRIIPNGSHLINYNLIHKMPSAEGKTLLRHQNTWIECPRSFLNNQSLQSSQSASSSETNTEKELQC